MHSNWFSVFWVLIRSFINECFGKRDKGVGAFCVAAACYDRVAARWV